ncbi:hypothetical protein EDD11_006517 [Mortierella claussenii]|nr:hypothetical protein EDD11_006517 [Mortierella claussenii]
MALGLFGLDYVTWKRSENYKGKRASLTALILAPVMGLFSFCSAIVFSLGIKTTCDNYGGCNDRHTIAGIKGIYTGISCAALAGLFFVVYASSEYIQYRRRHVEGDKW